jgi:hypothetical protein
MLSYSKTRFLPTYYLDNLNSDIVEIIYLETLLSRWLTHHGYYSMLDESVVFLTHNSIVRSYIVWLEKEREENGYNLCNMSRKFHTKLWSFIYSMRTSISFRMSFQISYQQPKYLPNM